MTLALVEGLVLLLVAWVRLESRVEAPPAVSLLGVGHALALALCGFFALHFNDLYDMRRVRSFGVFVRRLPRALALMFVLGVIVQWLVPGLHTSWRYLTETVVLCGGALLPLRAVLHHLLAMHPFSRRVLVLGTTELAGKLVQEMFAEPDLRDVVVGIADDGSREFQPALPTLRLGSLDNLAGIIEGFEPDLIVCATRERHDPMLARELLKPRSRGIRVEDGMVAYERLTGKIAIEYASPRAILFSGESKASWLVLSLSRALSFVVALVGLALLLPFLLPVALLIKLDSDGPVFFLHERVGLGGRPFSLIKFRTMSTGASVSEWAADNHHRTTRVGHWLRRFRIDELPQFVNILRGDMNLVGPRPHPVSNLGLFTESIPYYGVRCSVRPGVTGWAQIRYGYANDLEEETEKMRYDLHYIRHLSLALDLRILFETVKVVISGSKPAAIAASPGAQVLPIYFGDEHPVRRAHTVLGPKAVPADLSDRRGDDVVSIEQRRGESRNRSSRDVA
jgi:exopolysaccharide biosynthesis polyprenyl glycosylphosphotransferase